MEKSEYALAHEHQNDKGFTIFVNIGLPNKSGRKEASLLDVLNKLGEDGWKAISMSETRH
ncbi:hypothetical protein HUU05_17750 [candidate division KSB1 bacterium]|nr:hypothetical protein [candidate division KSB1 bacterium]